MSRQKKDCIDRLNAYAAKHGWTIDEAYVDSSTPIAMTCRNGHKVAKTPNLMLKNEGCKHCASDRRRAVTLKNFETLLNKHGWKSLEPYAGSNTIIRMECPNGHENLKYPAYFKTYQICDRCPRVKRDRSLLFSPVQLADLGLLVEPKDVKQAIKLLRSSLKD